jgi:hypothetical protein
MADVTRWQALASKVGVMANTAEALVSDWIDVNDLAREGLVDMVAQYDANEITLADVADALGVTERQAEVYVEYGRLLAKDGTIPPGFYVWEPLASFASQGEYPVRDESERGYTFAEGASLFTLVNKAAGTTKSDERIDVGPFRQIVGLADTLAEAVTLIQAEMKKAKDVVKAKRDEEKTVESKAKKVEQDITALVSAWSSGNPTGSLTVLVGTVERARNTLDLLLSKIDEREQAAA